MNAGQFVRSLHDSQFRRFLLTGVVNTLFGLSVYVVCILAGMQPWVAMLVGTVLGVAFNFLSFGSYAFRDLSIRRLPRFLASYVATYFFNLGAFHALHAWIDSLVWCQVILTPLVAMFSYLSMSNFVFRRKPAA